MSTHNWSFPWNIEQINIHTGTENIMESLGEDKLLRLRALEK